MSRSKSTHAGVRGAGVSSSSTPTLTKKYRRNGKLESCEPCRRSKLRCDHVVPACGRCVKRGRMNQCFYHPNPLTQTRRRITPAPSTPAPSTAPSESSQQAIYDSVETYEDSSVSPTTDHFGAVRTAQLVSSSSQVGPGAKASTHVQCQPFHRAASAPPLDCQRAYRHRRDTGFQGPTSHLSILSEGLGILDPAPDLDAITQESTIIVSNERIAQGCRVFAFFRNQSLITQLIGRCFEDFEGSIGAVIEPITKEWLQQLWIHHGHTLTAQQPTKIRRLSELTFRNTLTPLEFDGETTAKEWSRLGSGPNLRWEVLGSIALSAGLCILEVPSEDRLFIDNKISRACLLGQIKEVTERCLAFCRACEVLDDMFIWLLLDYAYFVESTKGQRAYATYRATGETSSAVVAMGLHQGIKANDKVPFFLAEQRKRALMIAYYMEASIATVLGRPFRLSSRYCVLETPLDLTDSQVVATGPELAAALANLDKDGYSKSGVIQHAGRVRSYLNICMCREAVVDLALGQYTPQEITTKAREIQAQNDRLVDSLPPFIRKVYYGAAAEASSPLDSDTPLSALQMLTSIPMRVGCQANEILLQRILIRKTGASSEKLIRTARAVFRDVLQITQRHDIAAKFQMTYNYLLSGHGLRVAAIIATELFKQEIQLPQYPENPLLPRSQTIQDLAVFAATLGSVDSSSGMHVLCQHGKRVITRILDRILSPPLARQQQQEGASDGGCTNPDHAAYNASSSSCGEAQQAPGPGGGLVPVPASMDADSRQLPLSTTTTAVIGTPLCGMPVGPLPDYGSMMDGGTGVEAPGMLAQLEDSDFMSWLEGMNWETTHNWSM